ncbi:MAG: S8 family serine peptidase [Anaerolineales bacterium]|nr:S8 family serine peptidase [Chloroflexota bacterium]MBL6979772.1 S8 family serine peptidase [Anaerolineales bacterium]
MKLRLSLITNFIIILTILTPLMAWSSASAGDNHSRLNQTGGDDPEPVVEPELEAQFLVEEEAGYMIQFKQRPNLSLAYELDWETRGRFVVNSLQTAADSSQQRVRAYLTARGVDYEAFWIDNVILVNSSDINTFNGLLNFVEIDSLRARRQSFFYEPVDNIIALSEPTANVEVNIRQVNADDVWNMGFNGNDIVVANIDTGVRYSHETLVAQYRGNLGDGNFNHNFNWWDPAVGGSDTIPNDWHGHGSHTMGIMVGDDGQGTQIGMAPGATWIACQAFEGNDSELLECGQFMLAPWDLNKQNPDSNKRPHIINNSWGDCLTFLDTWYKGMVESWLAAGIYPVFSNGNTSSCGYSNPPGLNTVGNPARYGNVTAVGSTGKSNGTYATHSNWGPSDDPDIINPEGSPNLKPQVVAPGVNIRSASKNSDDGFHFMSGTSMSAPHVSGLVALMWDAASCLIGEYAATETIIQTTARSVPYDDGTGGGAHTPNYATGWGEIDALAAVDAAKTYCGADFRIDAAPETVNICAPEEALYDINVVQLSGFTDPVTLSVAAQPSGASLNFEPNLVVPPGSSVLTLGSTGSITPDTYQFDIVGTSGSRVHTDTVALELQAGVPIAPSLLEPAANVQGLYVRPTFRWSAVDQAVYYRLEISEELAFGENDIVYTVELPEVSHTMTIWLAHNTEYYWRVSAGNYCGLSPSSTGTFTTGSATSLLLVDDDDNTPDVQTYYRETLDALGMPYEVWDTWNSDEEPDQSLLSSYETIIWFLGDEWRTAAGPGEEGEAALAGWLDSGSKCLIISGQDFLYRRGSRDFAREYLGVYEYENDVGQTLLTGAGEAFEGLGPYALAYPFFNFSDSVIPTDSASAALVGEYGVAGLTKTNGIFKTTLWAFPFEALPTEADRQELLGAALDWCGVEPELHEIFLPLINP